MEYINFFLMMVAIACVFLKIKTTNPFLIKNLKWLSISLKILGVIGIILVVSNMLINITEDAWTYLLLSMVLTNIGVGLGNSKTIESDCK